MAKKGEIINMRQGIINVRKKCLIYRICANCKHFDCDVLSLENRTLIAINEDTHRFTGFCKEHKSKYYGDGDVLIHGDNTCKEWRDNGKPVDAAS